MPRRKSAMMEARDKDIARRLLTGMRITQIAQEVGLTVSYVSLIVSHPDFRRMMADLHDKVDNRLVDAYVGGDLEMAKGVLTSAAITAAARIAEALENPDDRIAIPAAQDVLDRLNIRSAHQVEFGGKLTLSAKADKDIEQALIDLTKPTGDPATH